MFSFFFATMVAITMSGTLSSGGVSQSLNISPIYENDALVAYLYDANNEDEPLIWSNYQDVISNTSRDFYIHTGLEDIGFRINGYYSTYTGTTDAYFGYDIEVLGQSVSTNLYLTNITIVYIQDSYYKTITSSDVYFRGQAYYYADNYDGDFEYDLNHTYSTHNVSIYFSFEVRCYSILDAQTNWYNNGYNDGYSAGNSIGEENGYNSGYSAGYQDGYNQGYSTDSTVTSIFSGILQVGLVPINFFLACFNFEILGINLKGFIQALFTICITIIVIKTIFGGKGASDS